MPGILLDENATRISYGILIPPGHPETLYISSVGCLNLTKPLQATEKMDFVKIRVPGHRHHRQSAKFRADCLPSRGIPKPIPNAAIIIEGEPLNVLPGSVVS